MNTGFINHQQYHTLFVWCACHYPLTRSTNLVGWLVAWSNLGRLHGEPRQHQSYLSLSELNGLLGRSRPWIIPGGWTSSNRWVHQLGMIHVESMGSFITRWWFQIFFYVHPYLGRWSNLTKIFQMGCNHQLDNDVGLKWSISRKSDFVASWQGGIFSKVHCRVQLSDETQYPPAQRPQTNPRRSLESC